MKTLERSLEQHGFCQYTVRKPISHVSATSRWQKRIRDTNGQTLYFINAYFYKKMQSHLKDGIEFEAYLYPSLLNKHWITLEFHGNSEKQDISVAMEFFRHAYTALWCQPDPRFREQFKQTYMYDTI